MTGVSTMEKFDLDIGTFINEVTQGWFVAWSFRVKRVFVVCRAKLAGETAY
jgi:hypothetical protein